MQPRPLYRWKSFWIGMFALCCFSWAWWDSVHFNSGVNWRQFRAVSVGDAIILFSDTSAVGWHASAPSKFEWRRRGADPNRLVPGFEAPLLLRGGGEDIRIAYEEVRPSSVSPRDEFANSMRFQPPRDLLIVIPYWFLILLFLLPWTAFLAWRWRRMRRSGPKLD